MQRLSDARRTEALRKLEFTIARRKAERDKCKKLLKSVGEVSYFDILGITVDATEDEIRSAYRKKALKCHPDKCKAEDREAASVDFSTLQNIRDELLDSRKRSMYIRDKALPNLEVMESWQDYVTPLETERIVRRLENGAVSLRIALRDVFVVKVQELDAEITKGAESILATKQRFAEEDARASRQRKTCVLQSGMGAIFGARSAPKPVSSKRQRDSDSSARLEDPAHAERERLRRERAEAEASHLKKTTFYSSNKTVNDVKIERVFGNGNKIVISNCVVNGDDTNVLGTMTYTRGDRTVANGIFNVFEGRSFRLMGACFSVFIVTDPNHRPTVTGVGNVVFYGREHALTSGVVELKGNQIDLRVIPEKIVCYNSTTDSERIKRMHCLRRAIDTSHGQHLRALNFNPARLLAFVRDATKLNFNRRVEDAVRRNGASSLAPMSPWPVARGPPDLGKLRARGHGLNNSSSTQPTNARVTVTVGGNVMQAQQAAHEARKAAKASFLASLGSKRRKI